MSGTAAWWTDPHFELLSQDQRKEVVRAWSETSADCSIVTGDISRGSSTLLWLRQLAEVFAGPIYFVLGNHDFYGTCITKQREAARKLCEEVENLVYLTTSGVVSLSAETALVGHDGWGDMREGDWEGSDVRPPDLAEIEDLIDVAGDRQLLCRRLRKLGDEAADHLAKVLPEALARHERVIVATHVPPFREASWYDGENSTVPWLPFFCCRIVGDVLLEMAERYSDREVSVLCGHCHGTGEASIRENLHVRTGGAEPCSPQVQGTVEFV